MRCAHSSYPRESPRSSVKNGARRICQTCTSRTASATTKIAKLTPATRSPSSSLEESFIATPGTAVCYRMRVRRVWLTALAVVCTATTVRMHAKGPAAPQPRPTFTRDIAPLVWSRCAPCHRPGEIGPFHLVTYDDVKRHASQIAGVTARRIMPPWKPEPGKGDFAGARRLTDAEIHLIKEWVDAGAPEGAKTDLPSPPDWNDGWQLGTPDLVVTMPEAYSVRADG